MNPAMAVNVARGPDGDVGNTMLLDAGVAVAAASSVIRGGGVTTNVCSADFCSVVQAAPISSIRQITSSSFLMVRLLSAL
jgi:hypothetical protein